MGRNIGIRNLLMFLLFFLIAICSFRPIFSQTTRPVCYTQISAANQACSILSPQMVSEDVSVVTDENHHKDHDGDHEKHKKVRDDDDGDGHDGDHEGDDDDDGDHDDGDDGDDRGGDDDHNDDDKDHDDDDKGHDDDDKDHDKDDGGHNRHRKRHRDDKFDRIESSANKECCKWLKEVDNDCVCESLLRLPPFLVKPKHKYTIKVGRSCKFSFDCPGILHPPRIEAKY